MYVHSPAHCVYGHVVSALRVCMDGLMDRLLAYSYEMTDLEVEVDLHGDEPLEERPHLLRGVVPLWVVGWIRSFGHTHT